MIHVNLDLMICFKNIPLLLLSLLLACQRNAPKETLEPPAIPPGTPVTVTMVEISSMQEFTELNATATFLQKSVIKANANGYLRGGNIRLGQYVRAGQLLYTLQNKEASALGNLLEGVDTSFHPRSLIEIRSNHAGYVAQLDRQPGDYVQDGEQLAIINNVSSFAFVLDLPFELRQFLPQNRSVELILPDDSHLRATVSSALPMVDLVSQTQRFELKVPISAAGSTVPENLIARVLWIKTLRPKALSLPKAAVLTNEMQNEWWVMQLINDSTAVRVPIRKGLEAGERVEIVSPRFSPNDRILRSGNFGLDDTARVIVLKSN